MHLFFFFFFQAEDGIRDYKVTGVQTCALPIWLLIRNTTLRGGQHRRSASNSGCASAPPTASPSFVDPVRRTSQKQISVARRQTASSGKGSSRRPHRCGSDRG